MLAMRSLLFVPGDSPRKLAKGLESGADALILDLEDSVAGDRKAEARATSLAFLKEVSATEKRPRLLVRVNGLDTGLTDADLDAVVAGRPNSIYVDGSIQHKFKNEELVDRPEALVREKLAARKTAKEIANG